MSCLDLEEEEWGRWEEVSGWQLARRSERAENSIVRSCKTRGHHSPYQRYSKYPGITIIMPGMSIDHEKEVVCEVN
jgi:hypothetical protein